jgi:hypothetical protein
MKLPNWFKIGWWAFLLILTTFFLFQRYPDLVKGHVTPADVIIFVVWAAFVLLPVFQGTNFFGIEREIQELRRELKSQVLSLRSEIRSTEEVRREMNLLPLADADLPVIEKHAQIAIKKAIKELGFLHEASLNQQPSVDDYTQLLFEAGYSIECELRRIAAGRLDIGGERNPRPIAEVIQALTGCQLLDPSLAAVIREISAVCSSTIHGQTPSDTQVHFVENLLPGLLRVLRSIQ